MALVVVSIMFFGLKQAGYLRIAAFLTICFRMTACDPRQPVASMFGGEELLYAFSTKNRKMGGTLN